MNSPIGTVMTHTEEDFTFVCDVTLKSGEFVCYIQDGLPVLSRVVGTEPFSLYPSEFIMEPGENPDELASLVGMDRTPFSRLKIRAQVVGFFNEKWNEFKNPKTKPATGAKLYLADDEMLGCISRKRSGEVGSAEIGKIPGRETPVVLNTAEIVSKHLSVIAATGAGKSYTVGVLLEELMAPHNRGSVLVFDPHGEYHTLAEMQNLKDYSRDGYRPRVRIVTPERIKIRLEDLRLGELVSVINDGSLSPKMQTLFEEAYNAVKRDKDRHLIYDELVREVTVRMERDLDERDTSSYHGILWRMRRALKHDIFSDFEHMDLSEYFQAGQLTVLDLSGIGEKYQQLIAAILLRQVFDARRGTFTGDYSEGDERYLPVPVFLVLEEAHRFAPQGSEAKSKTELKTILSEGRKFGVGVCLVSQRPAKLDQDSLSQCMSQITMRIINTVDQGQIAASIESFSRDLLRELPSLGKGQAVISGVAINTPCTVQIRERKTQHGAEDLDAPREWLAATGSPAKREKLVDYDEEMDVGV